MEFLKKLKLENLKIALKQAWQNMPLPMLLIIATTILFIYRTYAKEFSPEIEIILNKTSLTLIITFFFSVGIYLFYENNIFSQKIKKFSQTLSIIFSGIFAGLFYFFFEDNLSTETFVYITVTLAGIISFIYIAPFIKNWTSKTNSQKSFFDFASLLPLKTTMSIGVGVTVMLLGVVGLAAIFSLFDIANMNLGEKMYSTWVIFSLVLFAPIFFLINLPKIGENYDFKNNKFYKFLTNYIGLTAITIYFIILYAYTIKVLINFSEWPQGKISWLVIGFSFFGYLIYFAIYNSTENFKAAKIFQKYFPMLVLPQVAMLFYAIFLRINQYDLTINRYLVVIFGIWLTVISLYYIFSKKKYLGFVPASLTIFILIISFSGPLSIYIFPEHRQEIKLISSLKEANILQEDGKIIPLNDFKDIDSQLSGKIHDSIEYLCNFHGCKTLENVFSKEIAEMKKKHREDFETQKKANIRRIEKDTTLTDSEKKERIISIEKIKYSKISEWNFTNILTKKIKVRRYNNYKKEENIPRFLNFEMKNSQKGYTGAKKVSGYDYYLNSVNLKNNLDFDMRYHLLNENISKTNTPQEKNKYLTSFDFSKKKITFYHQKSRKEMTIEEGGESREIIEIFDLKNIFSQILAKKEKAEESENNNKYYLDKENLTFELTGKNIDIKIIFNRVSIQNPDWTKEIQEKEEADREAMNDKGLYISSVSDKGFVNAEIFIKEKKLK